MKQSIKSLGVGLAALILAIPLAAQVAADYPSKPIRMVVPVAAGSGGDALGRLLADHLGKRLKQTVIVENKLGASGTVGAHAAAQSPADGYTILLGTQTTHVLAPAIFPRLPYDPVKDFSAVGRIGTSSILMVATQDFPASNLAEFASIARAKPGTLYGTWGQGSTGHFCAEVLAQKMGLQLQHIPYNGIAKLSGDMLGGHIKVGLMDMATGTPLVKDGKLKALAVCTQRSPSLPAVLSFKEQGVDFDKTLSWGMYAPAGVPKTALAKLSAALQDSLKDPEVVARLLSLGVSADFLAGESLMAMNALDIQAWQKIARDANLKIE